MRQLESVKVIFRITNCFGEWVVKSILGLLLHDWTLCVQSQDLLALVIIWGL